MQTGTIYKKGQLTVPKRIRELSGLKVGDRIVFEPENEKLVIRKVRGILELEPFKPENPARARRDWNEITKYASDEHVAEKFGK